MRNGLSYRGGKGASHLDWCVSFRCMGRWRRRCLLLLVAAILVALLLVGVIHYAVIEADYNDQLEPGTGEGPFHRPKKTSLQAAAQLRSRQSPLPLKAAELNALKTRPLHDWSDQQHSLLNMTFRPWLKRDQNLSCSQLTTRFTRDGRPTALVSLPSSGSTWLRSLIECATGIFTGSVYSDIVLLKNGE